MRRLRPPMGTTICPTEVASGTSPRLTRRKPARRGDRTIPRARLDKLLADNAHGLRERVLWWMLYETARRPRRRDPQP